MVLTWLINGVFYQKKIIIYKKMNEYVDLTYYQRNGDVILNRAKDYYENDKLSEEEKNRKENMEKIDISKRLEKRKKD